MPVGGGRRFAEGGSGWPLRRYRAVMDNDSAVEFGNRWLRLARGTEAEGYYDDLVSGLRRLMPDDGAAAAAVWANEEPCVLVLAGDGLFLVQLRIISGAPRLLVIRRHVVPEHTTVQVEVFKHPDKPQQMREWLFTFEDGLSLSFQAVAKRYEGRTNEPGREEEFARELASRLGWSLPEFDR